MKPDRGPRRLFARAPSLRGAALALLVAGAMAAPGCALIFGIEEVSEGTGGTTPADGGPDAPGDDAADARDEADAPSTDDAGDAGDGGEDAADASDASDPLDAGDDASDAGDGSVLDPCTCPITQDWTKAFGGTDVSVAAVALDSVGHLIVAGTVAGALDVDGQVLPGGADRDVFVVALDTMSCGDVVWARRFGDTGDQRALGLAVDPVTSPTPDAVVVTGSFTGTLDFGGTASPLSSAGQRAFVARLDPATGDGVVAAAAGVDPAKAHAGTAVASAADGTVYWAGTEDNASLLFVRHLGASFADLATTSPACSGCDPRVATIPGGVAVAGGFTSKLDLVPGGNGALTSAGSTDAFVGGLSVSGAAFHEEHVDAFGDGAAQVITGIVSDGTATIFVAGDLAGSIDFKGGVSLSSTGGTDAFIAKLDDKLKGKWGKSFGSTNMSFDQRAAAIALGNRVAIAGDFSGAIDVGVTPPLTSAGSLDGYVITLDPANGGVTAALSFGGAALDRATAVAMDQSSHVFVAGVQGGPMTLSCGTVGGSGKSVFVARRTVP